jgi:hypothetical protein
MNQSQFDTIARFFGERRTRREALAAAGAGVAALGLGRVSAQDATPVGSPVARGSSDASGTTFMFVQTFGSGSLAPSEGAAGELVLTADHLAGQTLFCSDRPERIVGMVPTETFLGASGTGGMGFTPSDPPNAALVFGGDGDSPAEIAVVELIDPRYDAATGNVAYTVKVLEDVTSIDLNLGQTPLAQIDAMRDFGAASLFIDDCPDGEVYCLGGDGSNVAVIDSGFCWDESGLCCYPCAANDIVYWTNYCNDTYNQSWECNDQCTAQYRETWACAPD